MTDIYTGQSDGSSSSIGILHSEACQLTTKTNHHNILCILPDTGVPCPKELKKMKGNRS